MACVDLAKKLWKENAEELKASKAGRLAHPAVRAQQVTPQGVLLQHQVRQAHPCRLSLSQQSSLPGQQSQLGAQGSRLGA